ncbi:MAG: hypothetical protein QOI00_397 [Chloroflexota bacterium]|jgi:hypothetical protein|nr:hypothetical protein [Chloroflexota bacterium]MEA2605640.1 hypothetical protein [Chloroflexota bacterium]
MNGRTFARILLAIVLIGGAIGIGVTSYNAGVTAGLVQSGHAVVVDGGYAVAPGGAYVGYGWGFGHGGGFFGFLGGLLFLFILFGLIRAAFGGGHRRGWGGPDGRRGWGGDWQRDAWEQRVRDTHDALHRDATGGPDKPAGS